MGFVTGSRKRLRELCKTEASQTSDFWEIFNPNPTRVGRLEDHDWDGFLQPFTSRGIAFDGPARKELQNWTGGVPVLAAALLAILHDGTADGATVSKNEADTAATEVLGGYGDWLDELWEDCTAEMQARLVDLCKGERPAGEFHEDRRKELESRGFVTLSGNKVRPSCRLMERYAKRHENELADLQRLFGDEERFQSNARSLLELRLRQVRSVDADLFNQVSKAIRELNEPKDAIVWARNIANRALKLIWDKEVPTGEIPIDWVHDLKDAAPKDRRIPTRAGSQCGLLRGMTGTENSPKLAKFVPKRTYTLVDHIQSIGDFGQHQQGEEITWSYAMAFCFAAVELLDSLARDFLKS
jgi:hypothetical protein